MTEKIWIGLLTTLLVFFALNHFSPSVRGEASPKINKMKVGVVDFSRAAKQFTKFKRIQKRLKAKKAKIKKELETLKGDVEILQKELKVLNPQSRIYKKKERQLAEKKAAFVYLVKNYREEFKELSIRYTREIVTDLEKAIRHYGKFHDFHIIFRRYLPIKGGQMQPNFNTVVYNTDAIDITDGIIDTVNKLFKKGKINPKISKKKKKGKNSEKE